MADEGGGRVRWAEISTRPETERFRALSQALTEAGLDNEVELIETTPDEFPSVLERAKGEFNQIRLGGDLRTAAPKYAERLPSNLLSLRTADACLCENGDWWLRNFFVEGLQESVAYEIKDIDLTGGVFILGATPEARAAASVFVRFGFRRIDISDPDENAARELVEDLRSRYFSVQFQNIARRMITQLPGVHSVAINTLDIGNDGGLLTELAYFNFLKSGGVWLDLPLIGVNPALEAEARAVGAVIESAASVLARTDALWIKAAFHNELPSPVSHETLREKYEKLSGRVP